MGKLICHQKGTLFIKCKNCSYSWNTAVVVGQEVDDTCPNCGTHTQHHAVVTVEGTKPTESVDIPEFMKEPIEEVVTMKVKDIFADYKLHYKAGYQKGLSIGISIGLVILGVVLFLLFAPFSMLPV